MFKRSLQAEFVSAGKARGHLPEEIGPEIAVIVYKRPVSVVGLAGEQGLDLALGGREHEQIALRVEHATSGLRHPFLHHLSGFEINRSRCRKVADLRKVSALRRIDSFNRL